jgi:predicted MFS family arabinose efflux permease
VRFFDYGLVIGAFFLAWFLGVVYIAKLSDSIGRKKALLVCLAGAAAGYVLTIVALITSNLWLMVLGRAVTGFTAGNQPVAQAAVIDASKDAADRDRNMGYLIIGVSAGLVGGPVIGGILSDKSLLGGVAGFQTPFYGALALVAIAMVLVLGFFHDLRTERQPFAFRPAEIFQNLWQVTKHPLVMQLLPVYALFMMANVTFYIFVDNYLTSTFGYGVIGGSAAMVVIGIAVASASTFLVAPMQKRFDKSRIVAASLAVMLVMSLAFVFIPVAPLTYVPVFLFYFLFGVAYPTLLGLFSSSVGEKEQGWVMGITTAVFCLAGGVMSLIGGGLMSIDNRLPFYIAATAALCGLLLLVQTWGAPDIRKLTARPAPVTS